MKRNSLATQITQHLSPNWGKSIPNLARTLEVAETTMRYQVERLEEEGVVYCENPGGKPKLFRLTKPSSAPDMSLEQAYGIEQALDNIKAILPSALMTELLPLLTAANETIATKRKVQPYHAVFKYKRALGSINLAQHLYAERIYPDVLTEITQAIYNASTIEVVTSTNSYVLENITLREHENDLFLSGQLASYGYATVVTINTRDIERAIEIGDTPAWQIQGIAA